MKAKSIGLNTTHILFFLCILTVSFYACKKKEESPPATPRLNYMTYKVNGVSKSVDFVDTSSGNPGSIWLTGFTLSGANGNIISMPTTVQVGTYDLGTNPDYGCSLILNDSLLYFSKSGKIKLSSVGKTYEGSFDYVAVNLLNLNDSVFVTEGKFGYTP